MKFLSSVFGGIVFFVAVFLLSNSLYQVDETEQVVITQFGRPIGNPVNSDPERSEAGLHFKTPFTQEVNRFEKRILAWDGPATDMQTREKLFIVVNAFARWRIADPLKFMEKLRDERAALSRLDDIISSEMRSVIARNDLIEVVRTDKARTAQADESLKQAGVSSSTLPKIRFGRTTLEAEILKAAAPKVTEWGIELLDVRFKRINYKQGVVEKIYERMASERMQIAELFRSEGAGEAAKILGRKEKDLREIESTSYRRVQEIQGEADAKASEIFANAYNSSPAAASFYEFTKTLETYESSLQKDSTLILSTESDLFKYLKKMDGGVAPVKPVAPKPAAPKVEAPKPSAPVPAPAPAAPVAPAPSAPVQQ